MNGAGKKNDFSLDGVPTYGSLCPCPLLAPRIAVLVRGQRPLLYEVVRGVSQYVHSSRMAWDIFFDVAANKPLENLHQWGCDGVMA